MSVGEGASVQSRVWTVSEAKVRLSEILRLASQEGPQRIGTRRRYRIVSEEEWQRLTVGRPPLGQSLLDNMPRGEPLDLPSRTDPPRADAFPADEVE